MFLKTAAHHTSLCAKVSLMGRTGNKVSSFFKRLLEIRANKPQHMGHVIHHHCIDSLAIQELTDLGNGLLVKDHTFSEYYEFGPVYPY